MVRAFERPYRPLKVNETWIESFPLHAMAEQLMVEDAFAESGRNALSLVRGDEMTVVLTVMKEGAVLHEHRAPGPATVVLLSGRIRISSGAEEATLESGSAVSFTANLRHAVKAAEESAFLIVIGGR